MKNAKPQGRDYQVAALDAAFLEFQEGRHATLVCLPTGTGKTVLAAMMAERAWNEFGRRTLFLAQRRKLVKQAAKQLRAFGLTVAVEMGQERAAAQDASFGQAQVVVATTQTLNAGRLAGWGRESFGLVVTDECHHARSSSHKRIYEHFQGYWHLGITATPGRGDEKNLGAVYEKMSYRLGFEDAIKKGVIVPIDPVAVPVQVDLRKVRRTGDDLNVGDLAERIGPMVEQLCRAAQAEIGERHTIVFTPDVASAAAVAQVLTDLGVPSKYVAGEAGDFGMKRTESDRILAEYDRLAFQVLVCCELLIEGYDVAHIECVVVMRPTRSRFKYTQMVGRGTRPCPEIGKTNCLVLDFDWLSDDAARDICSPVDLFDDGEDEIPPPVKSEADRMVRGGDRRPLSEILEEAAAVVRSAPQIAIKLTGTAAKYAKYRRDPSGVAKLLDVKFNRTHDMDRRGDNPATDGQLRFLKTLGISTPEGISKWGASKMISELKTRRDLGLATVGQVQELLTRGVPETVARGMRATEASLALSQRHTSVHQRSLFPQ